VEHDTMNKLALLGGGALMLASASCNEILGLSEGKPYPAGAGGASSSATSTGMSSGMVDPMWGCVGSVGAPHSGVTNYLFTFTAGQDKPATGLTIDVCAASDDACASPIMDDRVPDAQGRLALMLDSSFDGYLQVTSSDYKPAIVEIGASTDVSPSERFVPMVKQGDFISVLTIYSTPEEPTRGSIYVRALDCQAALAAGVRFSVDSADDKSQPFYFKDGLPSKPAMSTDDAGTGGVINIPPPMATLRSFFAGKGDPIGVAHVHVRPQTLTYISLGPTAL
jgi:hypothetical protein